LAFAEEVLLDAEIAELFAAEFAEFVFELLLVLLFVLVTPVGVGVGGGVGCWHWNVIWSPVT
jgi:hypothetical protein